MIIKKFQRNGMDIFFRVYHKHYDGGGGGGDANTYL